MSLLDNVRQTITDVAGSVVEQSKSFSAQTQLQMSIKKLQLERAKRIHELGKQTFDWYKAGQLTVSGPVPDGISGLCRELGDIEHQLTSSETELERLRLEAESSHISNPAGDTYTSTATPAPDAPPASHPAAPYAPPAAPPYAPPPPPAPFQTPSRGCAASWATSSTSSPPAKPSWSD